MTRRAFLGSSMALAAVTSGPLTIPVCHVIDGSARWRPGQLESFWSQMWPEAERDLLSCGIHVDLALQSGEIRSSPASGPLISGLTPGVLNLFLTDRIPIAWDRGRALAGITVRHREYHLCMLALSHAHCHQIPFLSINTCLHEILHALLLDILEPRPDLLHAEAREFRIDWYGTQLWLFHDAPAVRKSAELYLARLRSHGSALT